MVVNNVRAVRRERELTATELGQLVGIGTSGVCHIEVGRRAGNWRTRRRIARALEVPETVLWPDPKDEQGGEKAA